MKIERKAGKGRNINISIGNGKIGLWGMLGLIFVVAKLFGLIKWSWWLVTLPFWLGFAIVLLFVIGIVAVACIVGRR